MKTEILVVGSGIAGCSAAIRATEIGADVTLVTKSSKPDEGSTKYAQGGIAMVAPDEDPEDFVKDVVTAGDGESDRDKVELLVSAGSNAVKEVLMEEAGIEFDTNGDGYDFALEGGHSKRRVLHKGDATGLAVQRGLLQRVDELPIHVMENHIALELLEEDGVIQGVIVANMDTGSVKTISAGATILATGGVGDVYGHTTNPPGMTGDGIAMGALAGAEIQDMEYVQFHPTVHADKEYLLSEALRGEGAYLVDCDGKRFMRGVHPDADLAPRDVVATAVDEKREQGSVYLDLSPVFESVDFSEEFPTAHGNLTDEEIEAQRVEVKPAEHFLCGGIAVEENGRSSVPGLYAAGETACTGVHGANRLASTSLLEGLTWGVLAGEHAAQNHREPSLEPPDLDEFNNRMPDRFCDTKFDRLQNIMWEKVGVRRSMEDLEEACIELQRLRGEVKSYVRGRLNPDLYMLRNAVVVGLLITEAALDKEESTGCHQVVQD